MAGAIGAGNPHDHLARRQFAGIGGNALRLVLPGAVDEGLGADALDRLHGEVERDAAGERVVRNHKILGADSQNAGLAGALSPANCDLISSDRSGIRFIGGAPMKEATKVVAGFW